MDTPLVLNLHEFIPFSRANGPGVRAVIWVQGCSLGCPGCFNPLAQSHDPRQLMPICSIVDKVRSLCGQIEGITISGGEPFEQPAAVLSLIEGVKKETDLSVILFSGYRMEEIPGIAKGREILGLADVLVAGRFVEGLRPRRGLPGSHNQTIHLISNRYSLDQLENSPDGEVILDPSGAVFVSGVTPPNLSDLINKKPDILVP